MSIRGEYFLCAEDVRWTTWRLRSECLNKQQYYGYVDVSKWIIMQHSPANKIVLDDPECVLGVCLHVVVEGEE
jgi:hypothetical protein